MNITLDHFLPHLTTTFISSEATLELPNGSKIKGQVFEGTLGTIPTVRKAGFYALYVKHTEQFYFGSTRDLYQRLIAHGYTLTQGTHKNRHFRKLDLSHPEFLIEYKAFVIEDREQAFNVEQLLIDKMWGSPKLMNLHRDVRFGVGYRHSPESIEKFREIANNRAPMDQGIKDKISGKLKGRTLDPTHATNLGEMNKARWKDPEFIAMWREKRGVKRATADGVVYDSVSHIARSYGIGITTAFRRINSTSPQYTNWKILDE